MTKTLVCQIFHDIVNILEIKGENPFRIRAYDRAAQNVDSLTEDIENYVRDGRLSDIPGIGADLAEKIKEIVKTGKLQFLDDLKTTIPEGLLELLNIPSVGPKTAKLLYRKLKIKSIEDLEKAIKDRKLEGIFGVKEKTIENIKKGIALLKRGKERMTLAQAVAVAGDFISQLNKLKEVKKISSAGSLRRQKETVRDIDILMLSDKPAQVINAFTGLPNVKEVLAKGETKSSVRNKDDIQVDCRVVENKSFGAALLYFTGSKNFNIKMRQIAMRKGLKLNEYGVFKDDQYVCGNTEEDIFKLFNMQFIEPELREDTGEIELAQKFKLPQLIELKDILGDLHMHSIWSDGRNSILDMVQSCQKKGYSYAAITDHSQSLKVAKGLDKKALFKKKQEIEKLNKKIKGFRILFSTEVDIDSEGKLDYPDEILKQFDIVVAAIHTGFKQPREQLTKRIICACENKFVNIIAHPTGRLWGERDAYEIDYDQILQAAHETNTALEINSFPDRMDLNDLGCRRAKEKKVKIAINTDAHLIEHLEYMQLGVSVGRRGWLSREDVLNTLPLDELLKTIKK